MNTNVFSIANNPSETGVAAQTPFNPQIIGKSNKEGIKRINLSVILNIIDNLAFPVDKKKFVKTICNPKIGNGATDIFNASAAID